MLDASQRASLTKQEGRLDDEQDSAEREDGKREADLIERFLVMAKVLCSIMPRQKR